MYRADRADGGRACLKYFAEQEKGRTAKPQPWRPEYKVELKDRTVPVLIEDVESGECPVSLALRLPEIDALAQEVIGADAMKETGAYPGGPDSGEWEERWYAVVRIAANEQYRVKTAVDKAMERLN